MGFVTAPGKKEIHKLIIEFKGPVPQKTFNKYKVDLLKVLKKYRARITYKKRVKRG